MTSKQMSDFLNICLAITAERDRVALLTKILDTTMEMNNCDAGTLYLLEDDGLHFSRMVTKSQNVRQGAHGEPINIPPVPLKENYVAAYAVIHNETVRVDSVRQDERFDFSGTKRYDDMTGYFTGTMLVTPLTNDKGEIIGAIQLLNAFDKDGNITAFDYEIQDLTAALMSLAAISLTNMQYTDQISKLLNSLVQALSTAIDERTPYNANHTKNMVKYGDRFLSWLSENGNEMAFDQDKKAAFLMSVWLHDVGKLVVPLEVMDKESRLGPALEKIKERFRVISLLTRIQVLEGRIGKEEADAKTAELADDLEFIESINKAGFLPDEKLARVDEIAKKTYIDEQGEPHPLLTEEEHTDLLVRKGTLTADERKIMESHVVVTGRILDHVYFPKNYAKVPEWASAHHELLNGRGYPAHKSAEDIPMEVRLLTILDVFDALTARDRPYKPAMPLEKALGILHTMAEKEESIDGNILALFEQSKAWEETDA